MNAADSSDSFIAEFSERFPDSSLYGAGNAYDAVWLLAEASQNAKTRGDISRFLAELKDFEGVLGTYSASGDNRFTLPAALKIVKGESVVPLTDYSTPN